MAAYSVKKRLRKSLLLQMMLLMLLILLMLYFFMQQLVKQQLLTRLQHDTESLITLLQQKDGRWTLDSTHISTVYNRVRSGHYYIINTPVQTIRSRSLFDFEIDMPSLGEATTGSYRISVEGSERWLVWQQIIHKNGQVFEFWVAEDITPVEQLLLRFSIFAIVLIISLSLIFLAIQQKILDHSFAVFDALRNNLQSIRQAETDSADLALPDEIAPLVREIELLVSQLKKRIQRTRNAIGNLAHEIKRPLQILSLTIDQGGDKESAQQSFSDIQLIVDRELRRARISGSNVVGGEFNTQQEIPALLKVMEKIYPHISVEYTIPVDLRLLNLDRDDMLELCGNLIDNACKYAQQRVVIKIWEQQEKLNLLIEDDGGGIDATHLNKITQKGFRLDESRQGHGLGLSICADIVDSYQGLLKFGRSALGGLQVKVSIPLSASGIENIEDA